MWSLPWYADWHLYQNYQRKSTVSLCTLFTTTNCLLQRTNETKVYWCCWPGMIHSMISCNISDLRKYEYCVNLERSIGGCARSISEAIDFEISIILYIGFHLPIGSLVWRVVFQGNLHLTHCVDAEFPIHSKVRGRQSSMTFTCHCVASPAQLRFENYNASTTQPHFQF